MLKGMELPIHDQVYVHGMILGQDGRKMSKSLNNGVDPNDVIAKYPIESFRFYLLKAISSQGDGAFVVKDMVEKHNTELGNDFGNLIMRVVKLSLKNAPATLTAEGVTQDIHFEETHKKMIGLMDKREHNKALEALWEFIFSLNQYVNEKEPWKLKNDPVAFKQVVFNCLYGIHAVSLLVSPYMPETAKTALLPLGINTLKLEDLNFSKLTYNLTEPLPLFPKIEWSEE
jgi:methionyl-tRNA synthetase